MGCFRLLQFKTSFGHWLKLTNFDTRVIEIIVIAVQPKSHPVDQFLPHNSRAHIELTPQSLIIKEMDTAAIDAKLLERTGQSG